MQNNVGNQQCCTSLLSQAVVKSRVDETSSAAFKASSHELLLTFLHSVGLLCVCSTLQIVLPPAFTLSHLQLYRHTFIVILIIISDMLSKAAWPVSVCISTQLIINFNYYNAFQLMMSQVRNACLEVLN